MPLLTAKKEVFAWIKEGTKTIDVRRGDARLGEIAFFQCGANYLRVPIIKKESGRLEEVIREDNYKLVIPIAETLEQALNYLKNLYPLYNGVFTAYHIAHPEKP